MTMEHLPRIEIEHHVAGSEDDGDTVGWRYVIDDDRCVWCGEIPKSRYDEADCDALGNDIGWFVVLYDKRSATVLAKAADEYRGRDLARLFAQAIKAGGHLEFVRNEIERAAA